MTDKRSAVTAAVLDGKVFWAFRDAARARWREDQPGLTWTHEERERYLAAAAYAFGEASIRKQLDEAREALGKVEQIALARIICDTGTASQKHALLDAILAALAPAAQGEAPNWKRCPSTHCERRQECASPSECSGTGKHRAPAPSAGETDEPRDVIRLTPAEIQSGHDRVRWAEGLILQLPNTHDGRNSWLLNYGLSADADACRKRWTDRHGPLPASSTSALAAIKQELT